LEDVSKSRQGIGEFEFVACLEELLWDCLYAGQEQFFEATPDDGLRRRYNHFLAALGPGPGM